ncbi:MAG TPA: response regulator, partial [Allosphingosinicella sp.]|jgi:DNA-binding NtrC family response regulator
MDRLEALLVIDDKPDVHQAIRVALEAHVPTVDSILSPDDVERFLGANRYDCVLLDMNFAPGERSGREGLEVLSRIKAIDPAVAVLFMTAFGAVSLAVESLKQGADDFLLKPWRNDALIAAVREAGARTRRAREGTTLDGLERAAIDRALGIHNGNIARTAASLGLSRGALYRRMAKHGL